MKTSKQLLVLSLLLVALGSKAQSSAANSGIAIQGISRDTNNTANSNETISLTFELYYIDARNNNTPTSVYSVVESLTTDAFGVFSYVLNPGSGYDVLFANNEMYLKISENGAQISDEVLKRTPYAIAAGNGVPTGTIVAYAGSTAPNGWVLCHGQDITNVVGSKALRDLIGSDNAPNLQGMFLRGTGSSTVGGHTYSGPNLLATETDAIKAHTHGHGSLGTSSAGNHDHDDNVYKYALRISASDAGSVTPTGFDGGGTGSEYDIKNHKALEDAGNHTHSITGSTASSGGTETRPVNFGVTYIIKL
ncbi:phage tail protein [Muricauda sp. SCSIO 64092]|uniref:phage tail protein n=1 Tax=Allomuricauda sp. SCSIO 64092 TaxID=2908842 RepID=UPI001FF24F04|nr:phage tail protein [Muricauda sp. SCSIO 64092]UOY06202.1 phage tail protein [Muricauda sp. SCSIO 64092]